MSEQAFQQLISGQNQGVFAKSCRGFLWSVSLPYSLITRLRNKCFDVGISKVHRLNVPVIAIGNLTTGGTGKTPTVATVVKLLEDLGQRPGIVSRGYRADASGENDEKRVLLKLCPNVPHVQSPDRVAAAKRLLHDHNVDVIVLDDAFQHRRIYRDLNIVLIDATNPFGFGHQLPRGLLRESLRSLRRADLVLVTRANAASLAKLQKIEADILKHNTGLSEKIHRVSFEPTSLLTANGISFEITHVQNKPVTVLTAIGNPEAFISTCRQLGADVVTSMFFSDHHHYSEEDLERVKRHSKNAATPYILTTLKDLVKVPDTSDNIFAVQIETTFESEDGRKSVRDELYRVTKKQGGL